MRWKNRSWSHLLISAVPTIKSSAIPIARSDMIMLCILTDAKFWTGIKLYHQTVSRIFFSLPKQSPGQYKVQQQLR